MQTAPVKALAGAVRMGIVAPAVIGLHGWPSTCNRIQARALDRSDIGDSGQTQLLAKEMFYVRNTKIN